MAIIRTGQPKLAGSPAPPVKNYTILLVQSYCLMPLLTATSAFGLQRIRWSSPQQCYLHCLRTLYVDIIETSSNRGTRNRHFDTKVPMTDFYRNLQCIELQLRDKLNLNIVSTVGDHTSDDS